MPSKFLCLTPLWFHLFLWLLDQECLVAAFSVRPTSHGKTYWENLKNCNNNVTRRRRNRPVTCLKLSQQKTPDEESKIVPEETYCPIPAVLPVFPLRKSVKLPTETLNLNLYEPRYLAMCDYILRSSRELSATNAEGSKHATMVFGGIYGSNKPQLVQDGGNGPIVPMFEPGDVGTLFSVEHFEEGVRPTTGGRRIRIRGLAVGRFQIGRILHNGYGGGDDKKEDKEALPFILVESERICDVPTSTDSQKEKRWMELERDVIMRMMKSLASKQGEHVIENDSSDTISDGSSSKENMSTPGEDATNLASLNTIRRFGVMDFFSKEFLKGDTPLPGDDTFEKLDQVKLRELFSFAAILTLIPERNPKEMIRTLQMTTALERLEYLLTLKSV